MDAKKQLDGTIDKLVIGLFWITAGSFIIGNLLYYWIVPAIQWLNSIEPIR